MLKYKNKAFIMLESIISLSILSLGVFSLTSTYISSIRATKKFSESENLAFCIRTAVIAKQKKTEIPQQIILNNIKYQIIVQQNKIWAINLNNRKKMEITWNEK
ncbi:hypothetical protein [Xylocopilactobacillus apis]|uniref:hypothetical protein n=1 Tax=Xylocopilactobacillus apis TaxID=2932183 RepID=UPI002954FBBF|nr:hypothetical protein [Xylocopilactobacillus apis]